MCESCVCTPLTTTTRILAHWDGLLLKHWCSRQQPDRTSCQCLLQRAEKASKESKGKKRGEAFSGPHSVWDSLTELGGDAAAAKGDRQIAQALTQAIQQEGCGSQEEVAAALATQEMADAASGVMAEASRLASDIISAGKLPPAGLPSGLRTDVCQKWMHHDAASSGHCLTASVFLPAIGWQAEVRPLLPGVQHHASKGVCSLILKGPEDTWCSARCPTVQRVLPVKRQL